jgi:serine palmitoyltransferase
VGVNATVVLVCAAVAAAAVCFPAGTSAIHRELEQLVAEYIGQEDAITFGMGFATNAASIPAIAGPGSLVLSDALNHTSIVAGVKASGAKVRGGLHMRLCCCWLLSA